MSGTLDRNGFRELDNKFLLVNNIDSQTKRVIANAGFRVREDDNAMLVFGYIDTEAGISFELLCAACVFEDGEVSLEPGSRESSFKFRYNSLPGEAVPFTREALLTPYYEKARRIAENYAAPAPVLEIRAMRGLDSSRAPGYPDDILVYFIKEGFKREGIWCRTVGADRARRLVQMRMLNEPYAPFGKHVGEIVDVVLLDVGGGELKAAAVPDGMQEML